MAASLGSCLRSLLLALCCASTPSMLPAPAAPEEGSQRALVQPDTRARLSEVRRRISELQAQMEELASQLRKLAQEERELAKAHAIEEGIPPEDAERAANRGRSAHEIAKPWIESALQLDDEARRSAALDSIRAALRAGDPAAGHAALIALSQISKVEFDKPSFRDLVLPYLDAPEDDLRVAAFYALFDTARQPADIERVLAFAKDAPRAHRGSAMHLLFIFSQGDLTGRAGDAALALITSDDESELHQILPGLWGARVAPSIAERLLELSRSPDHELRHDAIYYGLSTLQDKPPAVVAELIEVLADPDHNNSGRALWGLGHGVPEESQPQVVTAMIKLVKARGDGGERDRALRLIGMYGTREHLAEVEAIAAGPMVDAALRESLDAAAEQIRSRLR